MYNAYLSIYIYIYIYIYASPWRFHPAPGARDGAGGPPSSRRLDLRRMLVENMYGQLS